MPYPRIIAHRCGGALAPENSLEGLRIAARLGCRGVEFDVMLAADGVPLLIHDETLERTTNGAGCVAELSADLIREFDAGGPHHPAFAVSPAPTFTEAMALCTRLGLWANVEIKPAAGYEAVTGAIVGGLLARLWNGAGVVSSFSAEALRACRAMAPGLPLALLLDALPADWRERMAAVEATTLHIAADAVDAAAAAALRGTPWAAFTVNRREDAQALFALGARAVFSDRPDLWQPHEM